MMRKEYIFSVEAAFKLKIIATIEFCKNSTMCLLSLQKEICILHF